MISNLSLIVAKSTLIIDMISLLFTALDVILVIFAAVIAAATTDALPTGILTAYPFNKIVDAVVT